MNFDYQDLKFWLEDKDVLPQAYWDALEDYDPDNLNSDQVLSNWLGYDHVNDFYSYEMDITYHEEQVGCRWLHYDYRLPDLIYSQPASCA
jgi:hypothetical protein